jgi:hypothetical protein
MTSTQLIGRETMISRLITFNHERIERGNPYMTEEGKAKEKAFYSYEYYKKQSTRKIAKEYDGVFAPPSNERMYDDSNELYVPTRFSI